LLPAIEPGLGGLVRVPSICARIQGLADPEAAKVEQEAAVLFL
jgi:hypothetical protein